MKSMRIVVVGLFLCLWWSGQGWAFHFDLERRSVPEVLEAYVDITPDRLNLRSTGRWVMATIELPDGYSAEDIDREALRLETVLEIETWDIFEGELIVTFSREAVNALVCEAARGIIGKVELTITGLLNDPDETAFSASDTIAYYINATGK